MYHYIFCSIHLIVQVKIFDVHAHVMYLDFMSEIVLLTCIFVVVKSGVNVLISPGRSIRSPPAVIIVLQFVFGSDVTN